MSRAGYSDDIKNELLRRLSNGETAQSICRDEHMPALSQVMHWQASDDEFFEKYVAARDSFAQHHADKCLEIADHTDETMAGVQKSDLQIRTRQWLANHYCPTRFSERRAINMRKLKQKQQVSDKVNFLMSEMADGKMSPEDVAKALSAVHLGQTIKREYDLEQRIAKLESKDE